MWCPQIQWAALLEKRTACLLLLIRETPDAVNGDPTHPIRVVDVNIPDTRNPRATASACRSPALQQCAFYYRGPPQLAFDACSTSAVSLDRRSFKPWGTLCSCVFGMPKRLSRGRNAIPVLRSHLRIGEKHCLDASSSRREHIESLAQASAASAPGRQAIPMHLLAAPS